MRQATGLELAEEMFPGDGMVPAIADAIERDDVALAVYRKMRLWYRLLDWGPQNTEHESVTKHRNNPAWWAMGVEIAARYCIPPPALFLQKAANAAASSVHGTDAACKAEKLPTKKQWRNAQEMTEALAVIGEVFYSHPEKKARTFDWPPVGKVISHSKEALAEEVQKRLEGHSNKSPKKYVRLLDEIETLFGEIWS